MEYTKITSAILAEIENAIGASNVFIDDESLANYAHDETEDLKYYPEV
ncbi:MAG: FAD-binding oxidoreductase, partial [Pedobacter sp.]